MKKGSVLPLNVNPGYVPRYFVECIAESTIEIPWLMPLHTESSASLNAARTRNGNFFLQSEAEWCLSLDSDMVWEPDDIRRLMKTAKEKNAKIVSGLYFGEQLGRIIPIAYGIPPEGNTLLPFAVLPSLDEPFKVDGAGGGCLLVHRDVFEAVAERYRGETAYLWNEEIYNPYTDSQIGEDLMFCLRAKEVGFDTWIEPRAIFGHLRKPHLLGLPDFVAFLDANGIPHESGRSIVSDVSVHSSDEE